MDFKKFLQKILNTISVTIARKKQVFKKKNNPTLIKIKSVGIDVNPSSPNSSNLHLELLKQISLSQLERAILAAEQIRYYPKYEVEKTNIEISNKQDLKQQNINVKVNAGLLPLPAGLVAILDICNSNLYTYLKNN